MELRVVSQVNQLKFWIGMYCKRIDSERIDIPTHIDPVVRHIIQLQVKKYV